MKKKPDEIPTTHPESEAARFVDFTRKLMSVPKAEIDEKQAEYQKQRVALRKRAARHRSTGK